jgi:hypothetical protein
LLEPGHSTALNSSSHSSAPSASITSEPPFPQGWALATAFSVICNVPLHAPRPPRTVLHQKRKFRFGSAERRPGVAGWHKCESIQLQPVALTGGLPKCSVKVATPDNATQRAL